MCGLAGVLLSPGERSPEMWDEIRNVFTRNLLANEKRGKEASGVALIQQDGAHVLLKQPVPASALVQTDAYHAVLQQVGPQTTCLLGHTRLPTKGSPTESANNHPLLAGHIIGVHNGHIDNDDALYARLALPRRGQVDSEIIFSLLNTIPDHCLNGSYLEAARQRIALLAGRFTMLSVDLRQPSRLLATKYGEPLSVHYHAPLQIRCFSSSYVFLRETFGQAAVTKPLAMRSIHLFENVRFDSPPTSTRIFD